ncbi:Nif3-like dinuclear metal center hexameric protein [Bifidobacterium leontopitheci]|uniref:GTP cyclohydrolase 1 type 2 homolog n=1 Tax=Bifidobacterium leontopitheci TaxID=2650774 RepID=A0A6I1GEJ7_9BIFI|nr:Nif3-like dinuclear metal center hexameric protein [Bifidobacterium leontopitheci]KAB7790063.1 Nif3-like dinuclear metal center hexameric protein [Bifidobacterium leontopitheci]
MATLKQVVDVLETLYPLRYAESWDAPGLIAGRLSLQVTRIVFAVDPTRAVIAKATDEPGTLLVCHHPLLFRSVHAVSGLDVHGAIVGKLYESGCALWVGHTNADSAYRGVGQAAADAFGLTNQRPLVPIDDLAASHAVGLGRIGELAEPVTLEAFARAVAAVLPHTELGVQVAGDLTAPVRTVAVLPGSGDSLFDEVRASGVDVYVTSDLRHHPATDAIEQARYEAALRKQGIAAGSAAGDVLTPLAARPALINTPHSAIESLWFRYAPQDIADAVEQATGERLETHLLTMNTDPWTLTIPN